MRKDEFEEIIRIIDTELKQAKECYKFHMENGDTYRLSHWFNGQLSILRKLKRKLLKNKRNK